MGFASIEFPLVNVRASTKFTVQVDGQGFGTDSTRGLGLVQPAGAESRGCSAVLLLRSQTRMQIMRCCKLSSLLELLWWAKCFKIVMIIISQYKPNSTIVITIVLLVIKRLFQILINIILPPTPSLGSLGQLKWPTAVCDYEGIWYF